MPQVGWLSGCKGISYLVILLFMIYYLVLLLVLFDQLLVSVQFTVLLSN